MDASIHRPAQSWWHRKACSNKASSGHLELQHGLGRGGRCLNGSPQTRQSHQSSSRESRISAKFSGGPTSACRPFGLFTCYWCLFNSIESIADPVASHPRVALLLVVVTSLLSNGWLVQHHAYRSILPSIRSANKEQGTGIS